MNKKTRRILHKAVGVLYVVAFIVPGVFLDVMRYLGDALDNMSDRVAYWVHYG